MVIAELILVNTVHDFVFVRKCHWKATATKGTPGRMSARREKRACRDIWSLEFLDERKSRVFRISDLDRKIRGPFAGEMHDLEG